MKKVMTLTVKVFRKTGIDPSDATTQDTHVHMSDPRGLIVTKHNTTTKKRK